MRSTQLPEVIVGGRFSPTAIYYETLLGTEGVQVVEDIVCRCTNMDPVQMDAFRNAVAWSYLDLLNSYHDMVTRNRMRRLPKDVILMADEARSLIVLARTTNGSLVGLSESPNREGEFLCGYERISLRRDADESFPQHSVQSFSGPLTGPIGRGLPVMIGSMITSPVADAYVLSGDSTVSYFDNPLQYLQHRFVEVCA